MSKLLAIFIGGGTGALTRWVVSLLCLDIFKARLPLATLIVNVIGSFIIGVAFEYFMHCQSVPREIKLFVTVGFCGGLTTFSTYSLDIWSLFLDGNYFKGFLYIILSTVLSLAAVCLGVYIVKRFC